MQYATVDTVPFIENDKNDYAALATATKDVLASIPLGLEVKSARYPVSHLFTSWPGKGKPRADAREQKLAKGGRGSSPTQIISKTPIDIRLRLFIG